MQNSARCLQRRAGACSSSLPACNRINAHLWPCSQTLDQGIFLKAMKAATSSSDSEKKSQNWTWLKLVFWKEGAALDCLPLPWIVYPCPAFQCRCSKLAWFLISGALLLIIILATHVLPVGIINGSKSDNNDRDLAWTQLAQKMSLYIIIEFKHYNF